MSSDYRIIGSEESPYAVKVRAYLHYKGLPYTWMSRTQGRELLQQRATSPLTPLVLTRDDQALQDSTLIIEAIESEQPEPSIHPTDPAANFMSALLEEFADAWGNKWMTQYRWAREADQLACSTRLAQIAEPEASPVALELAARTIRERMVDSAWFTPASATNAKQIENSFKDTLALLEPHLQNRPYVFGARPALADFGLWGQLYSVHRDPTPRSIMEIQAPNIIEWLKRMQNPIAVGEFESWERLGPSLAPLIRDQVGGLFLPWSAANARAAANDTETFSVQLRGEPWEQASQHHHARSLAALRDVYTRTANNPTLTLELEQTSCLTWLTG